MIISNSILEQLQQSFSKKSLKRDNILDKLLNCENIDIYCINRILSTNKLYNSENWELEISDGWYTQELENVNLKEDIYQIISYQIENLFSIEKSADKIRYVLSLEYGKILENLESCNFENIKITKIDIDFDKLNKNHLKNISNKSLDFYSPKNYKIPRGIVKGVKGKYTIVDGYHRISKADDKDSFEVFLVKN